MVKPLNVVMFDNFPGSPYLEDAMEGARAAGWHAEGFDDVGAAQAALEVGTSALVTALGVRHGKELFSGGFKASGLIAISNELEVPRVLLSGHPDAKDFCREGSSDIVIPKTDPRITPKVASWLARLAEKIELQV